MFKRIEFQLRARVAFHYAEIAKGRQVSGHDPSYGWMNDIPSSIFCIIHVSILDAASLSVDNVLFTCKEDIFASTALLWSFDHRKKHEMGMQYWPVPKTS